MSLNFAVPARSYAATCPATNTNNKNAAKPNVTTPPADEVNQCLKENPAIKDINKLVNFLSAGVGIIVVGMIILGGIQYSIAGENANAVGAAKQRITNALLALAVFLLTYAFLQWLIPGGLFK